MNPPSNSTTSRIPVPTPLTRNASVSTLPLQDNSISQNEKPPATIRSTCLGEYLLSNSTNTDERERAHDKKRKLTVRWNLSESNSNEDKQLTPIEPSQHQGIIATPFQHQTRPHKLTQHNEPSQHQGIMANPYQHQIDPTSQLNTMSPLNTKQ